MMILFIPELYSNIISQKSELTLTVGQLTYFTTLILVVVSHDPPLS